MVFEIKGGTTLSAVVPGTFSSSSSLLAVRDPPARKSPWVRFYMISKLTGW
jgi:hypothetical protein